MSEKEKEVLEVIKSFIEENGYSPTVREICELANLKSTSSGEAYVKKLEGKGYIKTKPGTPRSIVVINKEKAVKFIVNGIGLMYKGDKEYILIQEKEKSKGNISMLELPSGIIRESEKVYECLRRELKAKGFEVTKIFGEDKSNELSNEDEAVTVFKPFCVSQMELDNNSILYNTILCEVDKGKIENVIDELTFKWVTTEDLKAMLVDHRENICNHNIEALKLFCKA